MLLIGLEQQLKKFSSSDLILAGGDFNSRTGTEPDTRDLSFLQGDYELDTFTVSRSFNKLFWLAITETLYCNWTKILDGRTRGGLQDHFTSFDFQGIWFWRPKVFLSLR